MKFGLANYQLLGEDEIHGGIVLDGTIHSLPQVLPGSGDSLQAAYKEWDDVASKLQELTISGDGIPIDKVQLLAPSLEPSAIYYCAGNYRDHLSKMAEAFKARGLPVDPDPKEAGIPPWHSLKPRNSLCGLGYTVELPTDQVDWEIELAVVIGRAARRVAVKDALNYVAGYTVAIDLSARDLAFRPKTPVGSVTRMDWFAQKGFEGACPLGPWLVPASQIAEPQNLELELSLNGVMKQKSNTDQMVFTIAETIAHLSSIITLSPGDVILTGTPSGCGAETGEYLKDGDMLKASIQDIGDLVIYLCRRQEGL